MMLIINLIIGIAIGGAITGGVLFVSGRRKRADFNKKWNELQEKK